MDATAVLGFWFGLEPKRWFEKDPALDAEIRARFGSLYEHAAAGGLEVWMRETRGSLALVIVLDQFPRNMYRGTARAFAADARALEAARTLVDNGWDRAMTADERMFAYLPFEHSESLADQDLCCALMASVGGEPYRYALRHREVIARFGRFPHRNAALGRQSTPEEAAFLREPGSGF